MKKEKLTAISRQDCLEERLQASSPIFDYEILFEEMGLTISEFEIVGLVCKTGLKNKDIAALTGRSSQTIKNHLTAAYRKIGVLEDSSDPEKRTPMIVKLVEEGAVRYMPRISEDGYKIGTKTEE